MADALDTDVAIEAPEHIVFRHRVAGPGRRMLAHVVDLVLCYAVVALFAAVIVFAAGGSVGGAISGRLGVGMGMLLLLLFAVQWLYFFLWEGLRGRTPGKQGLGLRVVTTTGRPIGFTAAALRNVLRAADLLPTAYVTGVFSMALTSRFQRLGDLVAGTMVILEERPRTAAPIRLVPPATPDELSTLPDSVPLDPDERDAIELLLRRVGTIGAARELELAAMIAGRLEQRFGFHAAGPVRSLALLYDRAVNAGRSEAPPSSRFPPAAGARGER